VCVTNLAVSQFSGNRTWYYKLHPDITLEKPFDCPHARFGNPDSGVSTINAVAYFLTWVQNIHCFFTKLCDYKSIYHERFSFCWNICMTDKRCVDLLGVEWINFNIFQFSSVNVQCCPKVLGLINLKIEDTWREHINLYLFNVRPIGIYTGFCAVVQFLKSCLNFLFLDDVYFVISSLLDLSNICQLVSS
jgi:hypothetical protein